MGLWRLLAHNHWITLNLHGYRLRLCARCSGYTLGFMAPLLMGDYLEGLRSLEPGVQMLTCALLALPCVLDWVTQSWGLRESSNHVRLATGFLMGVGVLLFSWINNLQDRGAIFMGVALVVVLTGHLGKTRFATSNDK